MALAALQNVWRRQPETPPKPVPEQQSSMLLPRLLQGFQHDEPLRVLDMGSAHPDTVEFFSDYRCRLIFADYQGESTDDEPGEDWHQRLTRGSDICFDVCLFWDALNYMSTQTLVQFNSALAPLIHKDTLAHAFAVRPPAPTLTAQRYGISAIDTLSVTATDALETVPHTHTSGELAEVLDEFETLRGTLRQDGRIELLLRAYG